jgi:hypothetical protein
MSSNTFSEKFPFLTGIKYIDNEHVGLVVNSDNQMISFYDIDVIHSREEKQVILELGDTWWWGSNRQLPIDVFLRAEMKPFRYCLRTFMIKDVEILFGPTVSLQDLIKKRVKRRSIQLIRKDTT